MTTSSEFTKKVVDLANTRNDDDLESFFGFRSYIMTSEDGKMLRDDAVAVHLCTFVFSDAIPTLLSLTFHAKM